MALLAGGLLMESLKSSDSFVTPLLWDGSCMPCEGPEAMDAEYGVGRAE